MRGWYRRLDLETCQYCGKDYIPSMEKQRFCSRECSNNYHKDRYREQSVARKEQIVLTCKFCGEEFLRKQPNQRFCSKDCSKSFYLEKNLHIHIEAECLTCGKKFVKKYRGHIYCSESCGRKDRTEKQPESKEWLVMCEIIKERDNYKCVECGREDSALLVHHKKPLALGGDNSYSNLETLCPKCHGKKHSEINSLILEYRLEKAKDGVRR